MNCWFFSILFFSLYAKSTQPDCMVSWIMECMILWIHSLMYAGVEKMKDPGGYNSRQGWTFRAMGSVYLSLSAYILPCVLVCRTGRCGVDIISVWILNKSFSGQPGAVLLCVYWFLQPTARELPTLKRHPQKGSFCNLIKRTQTLSVQQHST